ncbi:uncharacterized protein LOC132599733 [Lycium barbarum]|uniref:uncharacterized protein LOC132599733 n=1 Tax=Lycium barbarum TaxID=112863 RepID=UPI00293EC10D|nr:uncharacterized protein LOC132599733 [Lycium barbarum]
MELFQRAESVRLRNRKDKYLIAMDDKEFVSQSRKGSNKDSIWNVEFVEGRQDAIRLKSCYGKYLTATNTPFIPGVAGKKVIQADLPEKNYPSAEWEAVRDGFQIRLKSFWGTYLRPNGGLPPWRNSITHEAPNTNRKHEKVLWDIEVVEKCSPSLHRRTRSDSTFQRLDLTFVRSNSHSMASTLVSPKPKSQVGERQEVS